MNSTKVELSSSELKYRLLVDGFVTPQERLDMMSLVDRRGTVGGGYGDKPGPSNSRNEIYIGYPFKHSEATEEFRKDHAVSLRVLSRAQKLLRQHFKVPFLWLDFAELVSREPTEPDEGDAPEELSQQWHMDNNGPHILRRTHTAIIYLNDGFEGGSTCLKEADFGPYREIQPVAGRIVGFKVAETPHAVTKIRSGKRYVLNIWLSSYLTNVGRQIKVFHPSLANLYYALRGQTDR